jgi:hypothetical protein
MLSNKTHHYEDTWDEFIRKINKLSRNQRKTLMDEARIDGKLSLICSHSEDHRRARTAEDAQNRLNAAIEWKREQRRMALIFPQFASRIQPRPRSDITTLRQTDSGVRSRGVHAKGSPSRRSWRPNEHSRGEHDCSQCPTARRSAKKSSTSSERALTQCGEVPWGANRSSRQG